MPTTEIRPNTIEPKDLAIIEQALSRANDSAGPLVDPDGVPVTMPSELIEVLLAIVANLKAGHGVAVAALHTELSTFEAAELLNVSRPHLIKLCDTGAIAYHRAGTHRRLRLADVLAHRDQQTAHAKESLEHLVDHAEEHGLYDQQ